VVRNGRGASTDALHFIHFGTIVLLFSMMLIVASLHLAGFFDWITELVVTRLKPHHLLPIVIFLSGFLSAFFVNDIICLVMVPFVLKATQRMGIKPVPYLLAVATASNIGSTATITGNPQNILIGAFSGIGYRDFLWHLGPIALAGLFLNWLALWWLYFRGRTHDIQSQALVDAVQIDRAALVKAGLVTVVVLAGFLAGFSPPLVAAVGAAIMLMTRTRDPHLVYEEVDWGLLVFFVRLFLIVGATENAGLTERLLSFGERFKLQHLGVFTAVTAILSNLVSNVPAVMLLSLSGQKGESRWNRRNCSCLLLYLPRPRRKYPRAIAEAPHAPVDSQGCRHPWLRLRRRQRAAA
jgi:Na+/H+ antiporter NhaD/arsenite permease-like protein